MTYLPIISLWQPWASLIFAKLPGDSEFVKRHETRGRAPPLKYVGGYIGIHSTAKFPAAKEISEELHELCMDVFGCGYNHTLPFGSILGAVRISGGLPTNSHPAASPEDRIAGNWTAGRFAWPLSDVTPFAVPLPTKGKQGWWQFELPPGLVLPTDYACPTCKKHVLSPCVARQNTVECPNLAASS